VSAAILERDAEGRPVLVDTESDASVRTIRSRLRFRFDPPGAIAWEQERGDVKRLEGSWTFAELEPGRTRATYALRIDPGRLLGMLLRGPAEERVRRALVDATAEGLKARAEGA
jgi:ribosome-associated toxin RatA of RatAB toxin-antitoxin module